MSVDLSDADKKLLVELYNLCSALTQPSEESVRQVLNNSSSLREFIRTKSSYSNYNGEFSSTHACSSRGYSKILKVLVEEFQWNVSCLTTRGYGTHFLSALHSSVWGNHVSCAEILLTNGAQPGQVRTEEGQTNTALHIAAYKGNNDMVQLLLRSGADPTAEGNSR